MLVQGTIKAHTRLRYLNRGLARAALLLFSLFVSFLAHFFDDRTAISREANPLFVMIDLTSRPQMN
jgi:hypothetical protein